MLMIAAANPIQLPPAFFSACSGKNDLILNSPFSVRRSSTSSCIRLAVGVQEIAEIAQNKVLVAASVSAAIGQLSKPFTSALLHAKDLDFKASIQAGGFPSTHSAAVVAAATSLGLERGFSDSIFGMCLVYASLVMYDSQGVRREVGNHAKVLNTIILKTKEKSVPHEDKDEITDCNPGSSSVSSKSLVPILSLSENANPCTTNTASAPSLKSENSTGRRRRRRMVPSSLEADDRGGSDRAQGVSIPLKESVGHTEIEAIAGALLGFLVGLAVYSIMQCA